MSIQVKTEPIAAPVAMHHKLKLREYTNLAWVPCQDCNCIVLHAVDLVYGPTCKKCMRKYITDRGGYDRERAGMQLYSCLSCGLPVPTHLQHHFDQMCNKKCFLCYRTSLPAHAQNEEDQHEEVCDDAAEGTTEEANTHE